MALLLSLQQNPLLFTPSNAEAEVAVLLSLLRAHPQDELRTFHIQESPPECVYKTLRLPMLGRDAKVERVSFDDVPNAVTLSDYWTKSEEPQRRIATVTRGEHGVIKFCPCCVSKHSLDLRSIYGSI